MVKPEMNYRRASSMGIPLMRLYIDPQNVLCTRFDPFFWSWLDRLPINWHNYSCRSRRVAPTPRVHLGECHPVIPDMFQRCQPSQMYKVLNVYGPCISTASWKGWLRYRKVPATPFKKGVISFIKNESVEKARQMLGVWDFAADCRDFQCCKGCACPVIERNRRHVGFRKSFHFRSAKHHKANPGLPATPEDDCAVEDKSVGYRDAPRTVLDNCILLMIMPRKLLVLPSAP
ncbi:hypothetical protein BO94DRAFT_584962 [Aspergillus sclerotioniger CBS 115572]|uniref:Uncharacterized protein n=1 Tax=Aspergillus sclerotioniger CBS 115572 TaxID=1450535 RepID=A0A317WQ71_9EURO|nr:hypothetical protein BO94DRAFT_584962 [Aspergillus sclerotioniger CBS 115572]PWY88573.1 hypothetical protein BO94DRAFT_584962 [Aspergillus sclerotioniger CBS 115572]